MLVLLHPDDREAALKTLDELAERFPDELDAFGLRAELRLLSRTIGAALGGAGGNKAE